MPEFQTNATGKLLELLSNTKKYFKPTSNLDTLQTKEELEISLTKSLESIDDTYRAYLVSKARLEAITMYVPRDDNFPDGAKIPLLDVNRINKGTLLALKAEFGEL